MVLQALWWNFANLLEPVKAAVISGYLVLPLHLILLLRQRSIMAILISCWFLHLCRHMETTLLISLREDPLSDWVSGYFHWKCVLSLQ